MQEVEHAVCLNVYVCVHTGVDSMANHGREVWSYEPMITKFNEVDKVDDCLFCHTSIIHKRCQLCLSNVVSVCVYVLLFS